MLEPTEVYTETGEVLRTAEPGEQFPVLGAETDWVIVAPELGGEAAPLWIARDSRAQLPPVLTTDPTATVPPPTAALPTSTPPAPAAGSIAQFPVPERPWDRVPTVVIAARAGDPRIGLVHEPVAFWNQELTALGSGFRLGPVTEITELVPVDYLITRSTFTLEGSGAPPPFPPSVTGLPGDLIVALSEGEFVSFSTSPTPGRKVLVGIRTAQGPPLNLPNVPRNVIAHEIGRGIGLGHNDHPSYLMCGRPAPCRPDAFRAVEEHYFPLTEAERAFLLRLYPATWQPAR